MGAKILLAVETIPRERNLLVLRWAVVLIMVGLVWWVSAHPPAPAWTRDAGHLRILLTFAVLYCVVLTGLLGRLPPLAAHYVGWVADLVLVMLTLHYTGGAQSPFIFLLFLVLLVNTLNRPWWAGLGTVALLLVFYTLLCWSTGSGKPLDIVLLGIGLLAVAYLATFASGELSRSFTPQQERDQTLEWCYAQIREQAQEREQHELELIDKSHKLEALISIAHLMGGAQSLDELLKVVVTKAREELNTQIGFLMLLQGDDLVVAHSQGVSEISRRVFNCQLDQGIFGQVAATRTPIRISAHDQDPRLNEFVGSLERLKDLVCVPLDFPWEDKPIGVLVVANRLVGDTFSEDDQNYLSTLAVDAAIFIRLISLIEDLGQAYMETIQTLAQAVEFRDRYTSGHIGRVRSFSLRLAQSMGLSSDELELISKAAILHDVGKIGTRDSVLNKQGPLVGPEQDEMKNHVLVSVQILNQIRSLPPRVIAMVRAHHERWDGRGYPDGLKEEQIPLGAQIIAVADTFDAMTTDRPYRKGMAPEEALEHMARSSGTQFSPRVLSAFIKLFEGF